MVQVISCGSISGSRWELVQRNIEELLVEAKKSNRVALARLLSVVERGGLEARALSKLTFSKSNVSRQIGITGAPGAGKSTVTNKLISSFRKLGQEVAVIAVDPSSPFSGGAILGDRVRMQEHSSDQGVYIRSMATRGHLGGLSLAVPDAVRTLAYANFPNVIIETVGVGQVEVEIVGMADTTLVVINPGWGDAVQANKAGLMEIADIFVINKADRPGVRETRRDLELMLEMSNLNEWTPPVIETVASGELGIEKLFEAIGSHGRYLERSGLGKKRREERMLDELRRVVRAELEVKVDSKLAGESFKADLERLKVGELDPYTFASRILSE